MKKRLSCFSQRRSLAAVISVTIVMSITVGCSANTPSSPSQNESSLTEASSTLSLDEDTPVQPEDSKNTGDAIAFTDDLGYSVRLEKTPERVTALSGSYAQLWLLAGGTLVGTTEDAVSERQLSLPPETEIIGTVKDPNLEKIFELSADFVLLSTDIASHVRLHETLTNAGIPHAYLKEDSLEDYLRILKLYTGITGREDLYETYGTAVEEQIAEILKREIPSETSQTPKALLIRSMSTKAKALKGDHMVGRMLEDLGADNIAVRHESLLEDLSMETILEEDPDVILMVPMGSVDKAVETMENGLMANEAWQSLSAAQNGRYYVLPKELFQYKPNHRWAESYDYLWNLLYQPGWTPQISQENDSQKNRSEAADDSQEGAS